MKPLLQLEHIQKIYGNGGGVTRAIDDISFSVENGEFLGIMGASGSGKTTLLNCISTIDTVSAGAIRLDTMFVDEGFGSLDDTAREQAIRVLHDLAGTKRLVGIISHVNELKEQIDCKLQVTKTEKGSQAKWSDGVIH